MTFIVGEKIKGANHETEGLLHTNDGIAESSVLRLRAVKIPDYFCVPDAFVTIFLLGVFFPQFFEGRCGHETLQSEEITF